MSFDSAQAILFGLAFSDFFLEAVSPLETDTDLLALSHSMLNILSNIETKAINLNQVDSANITNTNNLLDFVILAYLYQDDIVSLKKFILKSQDEDELIASRLGIISLTLSILKKTLYEDYFSTIWSFSSGISDSYDMTIRKIGHVLGWGSESHAMRHIGMGKTPKEVITLSLFSILREPDNYVSAMKCAMKISPNSQLIGQIVGALMGAKLGLENLPQTWVNHCHNRKYILKLAQDITIKRQDYAK